MQVQESQDRKPSSDSTYSPFLPPMGVRNIAVNLLVKFLTTSDEAQVEARLIEKDAFAATRMMIRTIYSEEISDRMVEVLKAKNTGASAAGKGTLLLPDDGRPKPFMGLIIKNLSSPSSPLTHFGTFSTDEAKALAPFIEQEAFLAVKMKIRKTYNREVCKRVLEIKHKNAAASAAGNIASETEELWCACGNCQNSSSTMESQDRKPSADSFYSLFLPTMVYRNTAVDLLFNFLTTSDEAEVEARLCEARLFEEDAFAASRTIIRAIYSDEISYRVLEVLKAKNTGASAAEKGPLLLPDVGMRKPFVGIVIKNLSSPFSPWRHFGTLSTDEAKALAPFIEREAFLAARKKVRKIYIQEVCERMVEIKHKNAAASAAGNVASETAAGGVLEAIESQLKSMELAESMDY